MAWVKLDDEWFQNPKVLAIGMEGRALWLAAACWVAKHRLEEGTLDESALPMLAGAAGVKAQAKAIESVVRVGLWHGEGIVCSSQKCPAHEAPVPSGCYVLHDWFDYQGDAIAAKAKGRKAARARWGKPVDAMPEHIPEHCSSTSPGNAPPHTLPQPLPHGLKNQHISSSSETPPAAAADGDDPRIGEVLDLAVRVRRKQSGTEIRNPARWAASVRANLASDHGAQIAAALAASNGDPDLTGIVANVLGCARTEVAAVKLGGGYL